MNAIFEFELLSNEEKLLVNEIEILNERLSTYQLNLAKVKSKLRRIQLMDNESEIVNF